MSERLLTALRTAVANPGANPRAAVLIITIVTILLMVLVIMVLLLIMRRRDREAQWDEYDDWDDEDWEYEEEGAATDTTGGRHHEEYEYPDLSTQMAPTLPGRAAVGRPLSPFWRILRVGGLWIAAAVVLGAVLFGYQATGTTDFCISACHATDKTVALHGKDAHSAVDCVRCHEDPPPFGLAGSFVQRNGHLLERFLPQLQTYAGPIPVERCTSCHENITTGGVLANDAGVRMSHSQPLGAGMSCDDCHVGTGHKANPRGVQMSVCMGCHDGVRAPSRCPSCHTKDVGLLSKDSERMFVRARLPARVDCGACHAQALCDSCHGIRLPHSDRFTAWEHGAISAFDKKTRCFECHTDATDCRTCHREFDGASSQHGANWRSLHAEEPYATATCACHTSRLPDGIRVRGSYCKLCHPNGRPGRSTPNTPRPRTPARPAPSPAPTGSPAP